MYKTPLWKQLLLVVVVLVGLLYALPNLFPEDVAVQVSNTATEEIDEMARVRIDAALKAAELTPKAIGM
ncbi:MAG: protein translocase subunit SecD, partial [Chromatiales bacterium]|nr:protein translocase subunit SecD [Chromatiales bacterium]